MNFLLAGVIAVSFQIKGPIDNQTFLPIQHNVQILSEVGVKNFVLDINSTGGYTDPTWAFINFMKNMEVAGKATFRCVVRGTAQSAAFLLYSNCSKRIAGRNATFMWHKPHIDLNIEDITEYLTTSYLADLTDVRNFNISISRATGVSEEKWSRPYETGHTFSLAEMQAFAPRFIHEVEK